VASAGSEVREGATTPGVCWVCGFGLLRLLIRYHGGGYRGAWLPHVQMTM